MTQQQHQAEVMDELRQLHEYRSEWERDAEAQAEYLDYLLDCEREERLIRSVE